MTTVSVDLRVNVSLHVNISKVNEFIQKVTNGCTNSNVVMYMHGACVWVYMSVPVSCPEACYSSTL